MKQLKEVRRETYGHSDKAINLHSERIYEDDNGRRYILSRTLDGCPPFFEGYGPFSNEHEGILPRLRVLGSDYWGSGWTWSKAVRAFCAEIGAEVQKGGNKACSNARGAGGDIMTSSRFR